MNRGFLTIYGVVIGALVMSGCESTSSPDQAPPGLSAPTAQSPTSGTTIQTSQPTLVIVNAAGATGAVTYRFEVARESAFANVLAASDGVAQGSGGTTSWQVATPLSGGQHFWRARASSGGNNGAYSTPASFTVEAGFLRTSPVDNLLVFDPLTNGGTVGSFGGGSFGSNGWTATAANTYVRYDVTTIPGGFVEFQMHGLRPLNPLRGEKRNIFIMWDPTRGPYTDNAFRVNIAKLDTSAVTFNHVRLRWISNGEQRDTGYNFIGWEPSRVYQWRVEWGAFPDLTNGQRVRVLLDGVVQMERNYDNPYAPRQHVIELGCAPRQETLEEVTYANVRIGVR